MNRPLALAMFSIAALAVCALTSCAEHPQHDEAELRDVSEATAPVREAAAAVVRIHGAGWAGTGAFISGDGRLLTNNHVLGAATCPREGCFIEISERHERGVAPTPPRAVWAVPEHVDVGLDMSVLRLFESRGGAAIIPAHHLTLTPVAPAALIGKHVTIVGHPRGALKKWSSGVVIDASGAWFASTAFVLPGDSGSPVLDDEGHVVGLIHRADSGSVTAKGVSFTAFGTAASALVAALEAPLPPNVISGEAPAHAEDVIANHRAYLLGGVQTVRIDGVDVGVLELLGKACDDALMREDYDSPEELTEILAPCRDAMSWIECRGDATPAFYPEQCPMEAQEAWQLRFEQASARLAALNGVPGYDLLSFGVASLQWSKSEGVIEGARELQASLEATQPVFDFGIAVYLAAFGVNSYAGVDVADLVDDYDAVPYYERSALDIAVSAMWLAGNQSMPRDRVIAILQDLHGSARVALEDKLYIENALYEAGEL